MKQTKRQLYCSDVQRLVEFVGGHPGKIDWDSVNYCFDTEKDITYAAKHIVSLQKKENWWRTWCGQIGLTND